MEVTWKDILNKIMYINIIDIREKYLYNIKKIKNSINIPYQFLITNPNDYLIKEKEYYIICDYGNKSKLVSDLLNKEGFTTYNIIGGIKEYENSIK